MNNNFTFNFMEDPDEEKKEPKIEVVKLEEKLPIDNKKNIRKNIKKSKFLNKSFNYILGFIVVIVVGLTLGNNASVSDDDLLPNTNNNNGSINNNNTDTKGEIGSFLANKNYHFDIEITEVNNTETKVYKLTGTNIDGVITGISTLNDEGIEYSYENNKYYIIGEDPKKETDVDTIYHGTNYKYSNIEVIEKYISKGVLESSSSKLDDYTKNYIIKIEDVLYTFIGDEVITVTLNYNNEEYNIEANYSDLLRVTEGNVTTYYVKQNYKLINDLVEE